MPVCGSPAPTPYPREAIQLLYPWRTQDKRSICYACCIPGQVAWLRRCRPSSAATSILCPPTNLSRTSPAWTQARHLIRTLRTNRAFWGRRSPSPRHRSPSPMRSCQNLTAEVNYSCNCRGKNCQPTKCHSPPLSTANFIDVTVEGVEHSCLLIRVSLYQCYQTPLRNHYAFLWP